MSLTDVLRHPWLDPSASSSGDGALLSATTREGIGRCLSDVSEVSEFPEGDLVGANRDASMLSVVPASDDMPGVYDLNINSPMQSRAHRPLEHRSKVLARELAAEAETEAEAQTAADAEPAASGATPPAVNRTGGYGGKRRRAENTGGDGSPVDVAIWTGRAPSRTRRRWTLGRSLVRRSAEGAVRISSKMMARRLRLFGIVEVEVEVAGMARDACCARGALALWAVRVADRVVDRSSRMLVKEVQ